MLTKYYLETNGTRHEITSENIRNWDQIKCAYSRKDFNGVVRSFSSQFEFVGAAYDLLFNLYIEQGVKANALLSVLTITDRWEWEEQFRAPLDFSTISWDSMVLTIAAIDNGLAALISANKSTKYEFLVGSDIIPDYPLNYDRVEMQNSVVHELMSNVDEDYSDGSVGLGTSSNFRRAMVYVVGDGETYENSPVSFNDQTEDSGSHFLKIERSGASVELCIEITYESSKTPFNSVIRNAEIHLMQFTSANPDYNSNYRDIATVFKYSESEWLGSERTFVGVFASLDALLKAYPNPQQDVYAIIGSGEKYAETEAVYFTPITNGKVEWIQGNKTTRPGSHRGNEYAYCRTRKYIYSFNLSSYASGSMFALLYKADISYDHWSPQEYSIGIKSKISTSWISRGKPIVIDAFTPKNVVQSLINKICENQLDVTAYIDNHDPRLDNTFLLAAESIRGIPSAKFYSSFNEFCDFMQTVFGYTYYLGDITYTQYIGKEIFDSILIYRLGELTNDFCPRQFCKAPYFVTWGQVFAIYNENDGKLYTKWDAFDDISASSEYNNNSKARNDKIFITKTYQQPYYLNANSQLEIYSGDLNSVALNKQSIHFVHRDKLFEGLTLHRIESVRDVVFSIDSAIIYSAIEVGYDKKDYEAESGRDEWNFTSSYSTGITVSDKTLSLKSKYRADCYGLEFLAQKRAQDSTDDKSDNDVFFVHCKVYESVQQGEASSRGEADEGDDEFSTHFLLIDRSVTIIGALSNTVFNGEYCPHKCLKANEAFIARMGSPVKLKFASSDGNSNVVIDGVPGNSDISLEGNLCTLGQVAFTTGDTDFPQDTNSLITFTYQGVTYRGFLLSLDLKYAHNESAKYKLIVKDIIV